MAFEFMMNNPMHSGRSKAAFQGNLSCPFCAQAADPTANLIGFESVKQKIRLVGNIGPLMREYQCLKCGGKFRYDLARQESSPYASFTKGLKKPGILNTIKNMSFKKHYIK